MKLVANEIFVAARLGVNLSSPSRLVRVENVKENLFKKIDITIMNRSFLKWCT